jgi:cupin 2 domain-containing protein
MMSPAGNLLSNLPDPQAAEFFETLFQSPEVSVERIVSWGQASPEGFWYEQGWDEWVLLMQGRAGLQCEGEPTRELAAGDWLLLPAGRRHRVVWTQIEPATVWLAVHRGRPIAGS